MSGTTSKKQIKQLIRKELQIYLMYTAFLTLLFSAFLSYDRILLGKISSFYLPYGYCFIRALIMAKVIMIGQALKLGERFAKAPLIVPVLYKTIVFCIFMFILLMVEEVIRGLIRGDSIEQTYLLFSARLTIFFAQLAIMFFTFILFFSVLGISRVLGEGVLWDIFFHRAARSDTNAVKNL